MSEKSLKEEGKPPLWTRDFVLVFLSNLLCFIAFQSMPAILPLYLTSLGAPSWTIGLAVSITTLTVVLSRPFAGVGVDRYGRRAIYVVGLVFLMFTLGPVGAITSIAFIFVIRFLTGIAWGVANTAVTTVAADVIPRQRFGEGMGYFSLSNALALAIAPALALFLLEMNAVEFWQLGLGASVMILFSLVFSGFISYKPVAGRGKAAAAPLDPSSTPSVVRIFKEAFEASAVLPGIIVLFSNMVYGSVSTFIALTGYEAGVENIGVFFIVYAVAVMCSRPFFGRLVDAHGYRIPVTAGLAAILIAMCIIPFAHTLAVYLVAGAIYGVGQGCTISALQTMAVADASYERRGAATSTFFIFFDGGIGLGALSSGVVVGLVGYSSMFGLLAILPAIALVVYYVFGRHR